MFRPEGDRAQNYTKIRHHGFSAVRSCIPFSGYSYRRLLCLTLRSGMLNLLLVERLLVREVAAIILSQVCWHVFSPGAEINQNSVMAAGRKFVHWASDARKSLEMRKEWNYLWISVVTWSRTAALVLSLTLPREKASKKRISALIMVMIYCDTKKRSFNLLELPKTGAFIYK